MSENIMDQVFNQANLSAREQVTEWVKLKEKLGTRVAGTYVGYWVKPAEGVYRRQISVALRDFTDAKKVVAFNLPDYFESEAQKYRVGDRCGAEYYKDIPAKEPGVSDTKAVRMFNLDLKARESATPTAQPVNAPAVEKKGEDDPGF